MHNCTKISKAGNNSKKIGSVLKRNLTSKLIKVQTTEILDEFNNIISDNNDIVNIFNKFFATEGVNIANSLNLENFKPRDWNEVISNSYINNSIFLSQ